MFVHCYRCLRWGWRGFRWFLSYNGWRNSLGDWDLLLEADLNLSILMFLEILLLQLSKVYHHEPNLLQNICEFMKSLLHLVTLKCTLIIYLIYLSSRSCSVISINSFSTMKHFLFPPVSWFQPPQTRGLLFPTSPPTAPYTDIGNGSKWSHVTLGWRRSIISEFQISSSGRPVVTNSFALYKIQILKH